MAQLFTAQNLVKSLLKGDALTSEGRIYRYLDGKVEVFDEEVFRVASPVEVGSLFRSRSVQVVP